MADTTSSPFKHNFKDISQQTFGLLTAISPERKDGLIFWRCACRCGKASLVRASKLRDGGRRSCGCLSRKGGIVTHGHAIGHKYTPEYRAWMGMKARCYIPSSTNYGRYGARGVTVCEEWQKDFEQFFGNVGPRPGPDYSLERIEGALGYEPGNVRWATRREQQNNIRTNRRITFDGRTLTLQQWSDETGIPPTTISGRIKAGWPLDRVLASR